MTSLTSPLALELSDLADEIALHAPEVPAQVWEHLRLVTANLRAIAGQVDGLIIPDTPEVRP